MAKVKVSLKNIGELTKTILEKNKIPYDEIKVSEGEREDNVEYIIAMYSKKELPFDETIEVRKKLYKELKEVLNGDKFIVAYLVI
ncbi:hypothetical protein [Persephonella sp.]